MTEFTPGELVRVKSKHHIEKHKQLAIVVPLIRDFSPYEYRNSVVQVRYLATGEDDWWFDYQLEKPND